MTSPDADKCLAILRQGLRAMERNNFDFAEKVFVGALAATRTLPKEDAMCCFPLVTAALCLLRTREGKRDEANQLRKVVLTVLDKAASPVGDLIFPQLMAKLLDDLQEYRRAIPYYEQSVQVLAEQDDPLNAARNLLGAGKCYSRSGLLDHAVIPLRAAVSIYRNHAGDPHLPDALLALGIALAKNSPAAAEEAYKEASSIYESKMQLAAAAPAWVNLGILCSKQERHAESLAWYQRALCVREQTPGTPPVRMGLLLNNMANCHRRAGNFAEAHATLDRAFTFLKPEDGFPFASACGTRGLIFGDERRDLEAIECLEKAIDRHQKMPSPNLESISADFEQLVKILNRLNCPQDAAAAQDRLKAIRATQQTAPSGNIDLSGLAAHSEHAAGAVLIELNCGLRPGSRYSVDDAARFADRLAEEADTHEAGFYAGRVSIPESTTLMFYGEDAETLYSILKPVLEDHLISEGARIAIRQGSQLREVSMPSPTM